MTEKLYWEDAYMKEFEATIVEAVEKKITLDKTAFCPNGGGLISDLGKLDGVNVLEVCKEGPELILHVVEDGSRFSKGATVKGRIDWARRYQIMKMHTAAHILSAVINRETGALITGNSIESETSRIDFNLENFDREKMNGYVEKANALISKGAEVKSYFMDRINAMKIPGMVKLAQVLPPSVDKLRIVEIAGTDMQADGGVHVKDISEIGKIKLIKVENKGKNNRRLYYSIE